MGIFEREFRCNPYASVDSDFLFLVDSRDMLGICDMLWRATNADFPNSEVYNAVGYEGTDGYHGMWREKVESYREESGRKYPPMFRIKVRLEAEELSAEEVEAYYRRDREAKP